MYYLNFNLQSLGEGGDFHYPWRTLIYLKYVKVVFIMFRRIEGLLTTLDKHCLCCHRVARLQVSLAQGVDLGVSGKVFIGSQIKLLEIR